MKKEKSSKSKAAYNVALAVRLELDRRRELGAPFKLPEVAEALGCERSTVSNYSVHYVARLAEELLTAEVKSSEHYDSWRRDFETFRYSLQNAAKSKEIRDRFFRLTIEDLSRAGSVTFSKVHDIVGRRSEEHTSELQSL